MSDLADSTGITERLGDSAASSLFARHDSLARELFVRFGGREIDKTDGFLALFERPIDAVQFALDYHGALDSLGNAAAGSIRARVGIHLGEVILRENPAEHVSRGAKPIEVEGLAKPLTARLMSLAGSGQTLLTRPAFDLARRGAVGASMTSPDVRWLAHGPYLFKGVDEPIEVYEVGIDGLAPLAPPRDGDKGRRALRPGEEELLGWRPATGDQVPGRPNWELAMRLGEGGFGEVWVVRHRATGEQRAFKFCFEAERLRALKREVTLFRVMQRALGTRDDIARVIDWQFERPPFFVEMEYTEGGSLVSWANQQGGWDAIAREVRLELVAQVADALAAAHSVGVLHKDIKPSNIIVHTRGGRLSIRLIDFGVAQVLDTAGLKGEGFSSSTMGPLSLSQPSSGGGTRMYMAPELLEGKPESMQSDIYALGILLFQVVIGDCEHALATGWETEIDDDLLREDIRACVHGDPSGRFSSAEMLARRLRDLPLRHRAAEEQASDERRRELLEERAVRGRRRLFAAMMAAGVMALVAVTAAWGYLRSNALRRHAETMQHRAESAELAARENLQQAEAFLHVLLGDFRDRLASLGRLDLLDSAATYARSYLEGVAAGGRIDRNPIDHAELLTRIADTLAAAGKPREALAMFEEAGELLAGQAEETTAAFAAYNELRRAEMTLALGEADPSPILDRAIAAHERLLLADPGRTPHRIRLSRALRGRASVLTDQRELAEARQIAQQALGLVSDLPGGLATEEVADMLWEQAEAAFHTARLDHAAGDPDKEEASLRRTLIALDSLSGVERGSARRLDMIVEAHGAWAHLGIGERDYEAANDHATQALTIAERRAAADPSDVASQRRHARSLRLLAHVEEQGGSTLRARDLALQAADVERDAAALRPDDVTILASLAEVLHYAGDLHAATGDPRGAQSLRRDAATIRSRAEVLGGASLPDWPPTALPEPAPSPEARAAGATALSASPTGASSTAPLAMGGVATVPDGQRVTVRGWVESIEPSMTPGTLTRVTLRDAEGGRATIVYSHDLSGALRRASPFDAGDELFVHGEVRRRVGKPEIYLDAVEALTVSGRSSAPWLQRQ